MTQISAITEPMVSTEQAAADVNEVLSQDITLPPEGTREIHDATARTIAGQYANTGAVGGILASLSQGRPVDLDALLDDIHETRRVLRAKGNSLRDLWNHENALDVLATWAIDRETQDRRRA